VGVGHLVILSLSARSGYHQSTPLRNSRCFKVLFVYHVMAAFVQGFLRKNALALPMLTDRKVGWSYGIIKRD